MWVGVRAGIWWIEYRVTDSETGTGVLSAVCVRQSLETLLSV
jgi:hypothetical protein